MRASEDCDTLRDLAKRSVRLMLGVALGGVSGIDRYNSSGNILGFFAEQKRDRLRNIVNLCHALERTAACDLLALGRR